MKKSLFSFAFLFLSLASSFGSQDPRKQAESDLKKLLKSNIFILRNFYVGDHLVYNSDGKLLSGGKAYDWQGAQFQVKKIKIKNDVLELQGHPATAFYDADKKRLLIDTSPEDMRIDIHLPPDSYTKDAIMPLLQKVFLNSNEKPQGFPFAQPPNPSLFTKNQPVSTLGKNVYKVGGSVTMPRVLKDPDPAYSEAARHAQYQGTVFLRMVVGTDGKPRNIEVVRGARYGLNIKAIDAVRQWQFIPGKKNGVPVAVQIGVNIDFRLYH